MKTHYKAKGAVKKYKKPQNYTGNEQQQQSTVQRPTLGQWRAIAYNKLTDIRMKSSSNLHPIENGNDEYQYVRTPITSPWQIAAYLKDPTQGQEEH